MSTRKSKKTIGRTLLGLLRSEKATALPPQVEDVDEIISPLPEVSVPSKNIKVDSIIYVATEDYEFAKKFDRPYAAYLGQGRFFSARMNKNVCRAVPPETILQGERPGFFVIPMRDSSSIISDLMMHIPPEWLQAVRGGRAGMIFDRSTEGTDHSPRRSAEWHECFRNYDLPASRIIFLTQNRSHSHFYNDWCDRNKVDERMRVLCYDFFISTFFSKLGAMKRDVNYVINERLQQFETTPKEKDFVCLNFKPKPWRVALLTSLLRDLLWDNGFISFGGFEKEKLSSRDNDRLWKNEGPEEEFLKLSIAPQSNEYLEPLKEKGQIFIHRGNVGSDISGLKRIEERLWDSGDDIFYRSRFSLIPESEMELHFFRTTEKPFKALCNMHPLIIFGNYRALHIIRQFGFKTFGRWIDEFYDEIEDPTERFLAAYQAFRNFLSQGPEMMQNDKALRDTVFDNMVHGLSILPKMYTDVIDRQLCMEIAQTPLAPLPTGPAELL